MKMQSKKIPNLCRRHMLMVPEHVLQYCYIEIRVDGVWFLLPSRKYIKDHSLLDCKSIQTLNEVHIWT